MPISLGQSDNSLLRYSENMLGQSQRLQEMAVQRQMKEQALVEQRQHEDQTRKLASELDLYSKMFTDFKDPEMKSFALGEFGKRLNVDFSRATGRFDEMTQKMKDIRTAIADPNTPEDVQHQLIQRLVYSYGDYIEPAEAKGLEKKLDPMQKTIPSAVATKYGLPPETTHEQAKALGVNLADAGDKDTATASLREFETVKGISPSMRGTPQYQEAYEGWMKLKNPGAGSGNIVIVPTSDGFMQVNKQTGVATPVTTGTGGGLTKPLPVGAAEGLAELDSLQMSIKNVRDSFDASYVGPYDSARGAVTGWTDVGADPSEQSFRANVAALRKVLFSEGGKALTVPEMKVLEPLIPDTGVGATKFLQQLNVFEQKYQDIMEKKKKAYKETGYGVPTTSGGGRRSLDTFGR